MENKPLGERLRIAIFALGYKKISDFISATGMTKSTAYAVLNDHTKEPGSGFLKKCYYAGINLNWLITGEGEMLLEEKANPESIERIKAAGGAPENYPAPKKSTIMEKKIADRMSEMIGIMSGRDILKEMNEYLDQLEELEPDQREMFHTMAKVFIESAQKRKNNPQ